VYTYWYSTYTIGNTTYFDYSHKQFTGYDYSEVSTSSSSSGGLPEFNENGPNSAGVYKKRNIGGSSADDAIILIRDEVDAGIINELTGKAECIYGKLILSAVNNHNIITDTFLYFGDENPFDNIILILSLSDALGTKALKESVSTSFPLESVYRNPPNAMLL